MESVPRLTSQPRAPQRAASISCVRERSRRSLRTCVPMTFCSWALMLFVAEPTVEGAQARVLRFWSARTTASGFLLFHRPSYSPLTARRLTARHADGSLCSVFGASALIPTSQRHKDHPLNEPYQYRVRPIAESGYDYADSPTRPRLITPSATVPHNRKPFSPA